MKPLPWLVLGVALAAYAISLVWAASVLPQQVAAHFNAAGAADNWMSREAHLAFMAFFGLGMPLLLLAVFYSIRFFPASLVNMPNREYWLAPERRPETSRVLTRYGAWFAAMQTLLALGVHLLTVEANRRQPPQLSSAAWVLIGLFLATVVAWLISLWRDFQLPKSGKLV